MAAISEMNPKMNASIMILPDIPRDSSLRGLYDEEKQLFEEMFSLAQSIENRWVEVYGRENKRAEKASNSRRFGSGRVVTSASSVSENVWLDSELCVFGRVVGQNETVEGAPVALLPKTSSLLIPEPASPDPRSFDLGSLCFSPCFPPIKSNDLSHPPAIHLFVLPGSSPAGRLTSGQRSCPRPLAPKQ